MNVRWLNNPEKPKKDGQYLSRSKFGSYIVYEVLYWEKGIWLDVEKNYVKSVNAFIDVELSELK